MWGGCTQQHDSGFECEARLLLGALPRRAWAHAQLLLVFSVKSIVVVGDLQVEVRRCAPARGGGRVQSGVHTYPWHRCVRLYRKPGCPDARFGT